MRLLGIGLTSFDELAQKSLLFDDGAPRKGAQIDELRDKVREKFGRKALIRASDLEK